MTEKQVNRYAKLTRLINKLEGERTALKELLLTDFASGGSCPKSGPFVVKVIVQHRKKLDWKGWAVALAQQFKANKTLKRWEEEADEYECQVLQVTPNPDWKGG